MFMCSAKIWFSPCGGIGRHTSFRNWSFWRVGSSPTKGSTKRVLRNLVSGFHSFGLVALKLCFTVGTAFFIASSKKNLDYTETTVVCLISKLLQSIKSWWVYFYIVKINTGKKLSYKVLLC